MLLGLVARYRRRRLLGRCCAVGQGVQCDLNVKLVYAHRITLGDYVYVGTGCYLNGRGDLTIHEHAILAPEVCILTAMHRYKGADLAPYDQVELLRPVTIGRAVWIGMRAMILPGVTLGEGSIVGAGAVVTKSCDPGTILGGNPAVPIAQRDMEHYQALVEQEKFYLLHKQISRLTKEEVRDR